MRRKLAPRKEKRVQQAERTKKIMVQLTSKVQVVIAQITSPMNHRKTTLVELQAVGQRVLWL
jgi:hypothetical protein